MAYRGLTFQIPHYNNIEQYVKNGYVYAFEVLTLVKGELSLKAQRSTVLIAME